MALGTGKKNFGLCNDANANVVDEYSLSTGKDDLYIVKFGGRDQSSSELGNKDFVIGFYIGTSAITLTNYAGLPEGSIIIDRQAYKTHYKVAASGTDTWKSSAAAT